MSAQVWFDIVVAAVLIGQTVRPVWLAVVTSFLAALIIGQFVGGQS